MSSMTLSERVVIVGSGCAGLTAAIYAARAQLTPLVLQGNLPGGLLTQTTTVENFPGFHEGIQGLTLTDQMRKQAEKFGARFLLTSVTRVIQEGNNKKQLELSDGTCVLTEALIVATGSRPNTLNLPQETTLLGGKGLSVCATCDGFFYRNEVVCVIGGGDSACEEALYLSKICTKVYLIHRRDQLRASKIMADRVLNNEKIEIVWNSIPNGFECDAQGFVTGVKLASTVDHTSKIVACKGVFLAIGWKPNTEIFKNFLDLDEQGYVKISKRAVCTSYPGVFAAGDCVDAFYRQACVAAGMGAQAALEAERWLMARL